MREQETGHRDSFIVRIWREAGRPGWLGWVQHARTGESVSVRGPDELLAFIEQRTGILGDSARKGLK
jgi:hypothetical protein